MQRIALMLLVLAMLAAFTGCERSKYKYGAKAKPKDRPEYTVGPSRNSP